MAETSIQTPQSAVLGGCTARPNDATLISNESHPRYLCNSNLHHLDVNSKVNSRVQLILIHDQVGDRLGNREPTSESPMPAGLFYLGLPSGS